MPTTTNFNKLAFISWVLILGACATAPVPLSNVDLVWKPTSDIVSLPPGKLNNVLDVKIQFEAFKDVRSQPTLIAENHEDPMPKPVTTQDNVGQFVSQHVRETFSQFGLKTVDHDGDVIISGELRQFFVLETTTYKGHVVLKLNVQNKSGKTIWTGEVVGMATRFGRSYSLENYSEVFSDSIVNAVSSLMLQDDFLRALAAK